MTLLHWDKGSPKISAIRAIKEPSEMTALKYRGIGEQSEREILTVVVPEERGDEIFEYIFNVAGINKPHGGFIYMSSMLSSEYCLPENLQDEC